MTLRPLLASLVLSVLAVGCGLTRPEVAPSERAADSLLPARVRRLSNLELERALAFVLEPLRDDERLEVSKRLPPDVRQSGYTPNAQQSLPAATGVRWATVIDELTNAAVERNLQHFLPCDSGRCSEAFIAKSARRAWRRALSLDERASLLALFAQGVADQGARGGVQLVLSGLLQSPSFMYLTELGEPSGQGPATRLSSAEVASALSFMLSGAPPDDELLRLAEANELISPESRTAQARRILARSSTRHHFRQFLLEWLEVDGLEDTAKDGEQHPRYEQLKSHMLAETRAFVDEVMVHRGASVGALLAGGFASVDPSMARYYGLPAFGAAVPLHQVPRVGVLQQASFLSAHSHPNSTGPVLRGDFVLRKVLCKRLPRPAELGIEVVMPRPQPGQTTRERFQQHTSDPQCQTCHQTIDPLGFAFEGFDAAGAERTTEMEKPVDSRAQLSLFGKKMSFKDSAELSVWLANQPQSRECFARQAFRYFSAQTDEQVETAFLSLTAELPPEKRGSLVEILVNYAGSDLFLYRSRLNQEGHGT